MKKTAKVKKPVKAQNALTPKQERFCQEYVIDLNGTQAAIRSGYSEKTAKEQAAQHLTKLNVQEKIKELQTVIAEKKQIDAEWVLNRFMQISDRCMEAEPVRDKQGNPTGFFIFDSSGANKATENIGKHIGFFERDNKQKADLTLSGFSWDALIKKPEQGK